jgi:type IV pilus assembly protein PilA
MFCPKCGKENPEGAQLCSSCSWVLSSIPAVPPANAKTSAAAIWALVLGILAPLTCLITMLPAIICAIVGLVKISRSRGQLKGTGLAVAGMLIPFAALPIIAILMAILMPALNKTRCVAYRLVCGTNMASLGKATMAYVDEYRSYPDASKWCDLLVKKENVDPSQFQCKGSPNDGRSNYAMNRNVEELGANAPADMVLIFETEAGWNQNGGPELLTLENHEGNGCNVVFADGHVEFVLKNDLPDLKWTPWAAQPAAPDLSGSIDAAKWSEAKAMMGTIATAIRAYAAEKGPNGAPPTSITELGLTDADLQGTYFQSSDFGFSVTSLEPLTFTITCTPTGPNAPLNPKTMTLNQDGTWTP